MRQLSAGLSGETPTRCVKQSRPKVASIGIRRRVNGAENFRTTSMNCQNSKITGAKSKHGPPLGGGQRYGPIPGRGGARPITSPGRTSSGSGNAPNPPGAGLRKPRGSPILGAKFGRLKIQFFMLRYNGVLSGNYLTPFPPAF